MRLSLAPVLLSLASAAAAVSAQATSPTAPQASAPASAPAEAAASQTPSFPSAVEQVVVDVVVTDKKGKPVRGLKREDMSVLEDGTPQAITSFEAIELPDQPPAAVPPEPLISTNTAVADKRGRTFAIVFDDTHLTPWRANQAKAAVASFLDKSVREGDRVTLVSTAGNIWWTSRMEAGKAKLLDLVKRLDGRYIPDNSSERMSENEALRIHIYRDPIYMERVLRRWEQFGVQPARMGAGDTSSGGIPQMTDDPLVTAKASEVYYQATVRIRTTLDALERVVNGLAAAKGRKSVILISEGFIQDINIREFRSVNEAARRANVAIYFVNARGLDAMPAEMTAQFGPALPDQDMGFYLTDPLDAVAGSEAVAADSGGFTVRNTNDLGAGMQRIGNEMQAYYLLGYNPTNTARDGRFRKIQVKLADGKGLQIRARRGYYAPSDTPEAASAKPGIDPVFQAALDSPWMQDGLPLRMTHFVGDEKLLGKAAVVITTEVDVRNVGFEQKDGRSVASLQFLLIVVHRESGEYFRYDQTYNMKLLPSTRQRLERFWFPISRDFELAAGDYQAKMVVRDARSGRVGTVIHEFEVPRIDQFRVSTPVLSDQVQPTHGAETAPAGQLIPIARREFAKGTQLLCRIEVYGAQKDAKTGMPKVTQGYVVVRRSDGAVVTAMAPNMIQPTSLGLLSRLFGFRLDTEPGAYEIQMNVRDELNGKALELHEPFTVVAAPAKAAAN